MLKQIGTTIPAVFAAFLVALTVTVLQSGSVRAADCIAGPNSHAPQGSHWYYRIDRVKQRKCWYFRPRARKFATQSRKCTQQNDCWRPRGQRRPVAA